MGIFSANDSILKVEYPAGSGIFTSVAYLTKADISQSAPAVVVSDLLFHAGEKFAPDDSVNASTLSASGFAATEFASAILERLFLSRESFLVEFYSTTQTLSSGPIVNQIPLSDGYDDQYGPIAIAKDVEIVAVQPVSGGSVYGPIEIYEKSAGDYVLQTSIDISGGQVYKMDISADGLKLVIFESNYSSGVKTYTRATTSDSFTLASSYLFTAGGSAWGDLVISGNGLVLVAAAGTGGTDQKRVHDWTGGTWVARGNTTNPAGIYASGVQISVSHDGTAIALPHDESNLSYVIDWNGSAWSSRAPGAFDVVAGSSCTALINSGNTIVTGATGADTDIRFYDYSGGAWSLASTFDYYPEINSYGFFHGASSDGNRVFILPFSDYIFREIVIDPPPEPNKFVSAAKITALAMNASKSGPVELSISLQLANVEASA